MVWAQVQPWTDILCPFPLCSPEATNSTCKQPQISAFAPQQTLLTRAHTLGQANIYAVGFHPDLCLQEWAWGGTVQIQLLELVSRLTAALLCRKSWAGGSQLTDSWHKAWKVWWCHQPMDQKSSTSWAFHSSMIFIPFIFLNLFRKPSVRG